MKQIERVALPSPSAGTTRELVFHRYGGAGARPKAYIQASLHADEVPAMLVAHHLVRLLDAAEAAGCVRGEIIVLPVANPIGLDQEVGGTHLGRHELAGGGNFNRAWPDLSDAVAARVEGTLGGDEAQNERLVRKALADAAAAIEARDALGAMRRAIVARAADADIVLDLHCDSEAMLYLYLSRAIADWRAGADLLAQTGAAWMLLSEDPGGQSFEDVMSGTWRKLKMRFPAHPLPRGCLASTLEYRGQSDVDDATAKADADNLMRFLVGRGLISGAAFAPDAKGEAIPLEAVDVVRAPHAGLVAMRARLGQRVKAGEAVAELIDLNDPQAPRTILAAQTDGQVFSHLRDRLVRAGAPVAKIAGRTPLPSRTGYLLED